MKKFTLAAGAVLALAFATPAHADEGWLSISNRFPSPGTAEQVVVTQCKREAQSIFQSARTMFPEGSRAPDMKEIGYMRDCMIERAPSGAEPATKQASPVVPPAKRGKRT